MAQLDFCVGDITANTDKIIDGARRARDELGGDIIVFPELALTGYPPEDLLFRPGLHRRVEDALGRIVPASKDIVIVAGHPQRSDAGVYNSCTVFKDGQVLATYHKQQLPNYAVFDEKRYFLPGTAPCVIDIGGFNVALSICEDIWKPETAVQGRDAGAALIVNLNASPYHRGKHADRLKAIRRAVDLSGLPIVYVNLVGGQDELVFDGGSMAVDATGAVCVAGREFKEDLVPVEITRNGDRLTLDGPQHQPLDDEASVYEALVLGVRDYVTKNRFNGVVLGLSGGIDSALTLTIAVDALGAEHVEAVSMPSRYTANMSVEDALEQTRRLNCACHVVSIDRPVAAFTDILAPVFEGAGQDVTEENIQARCRGVVLMAISNKKRRIVLTTGNKSEMAVGYATLYGDMAGGFAPLKDVPKLLVYRLARWRNKRSEVIPARVIERPPSAELAPDQRDSDSLPPYEQLDPILEYYIEHDLTPREIWEKGFDRDVVRDVAAMVDRNEYKRRQAAPGVRITQRAFGRDRRFPITSRYSERQALT